MDARRFDESSAAQHEEQNMSSGAIVVLTTVANTEAAEILARKIIESKLAACVQVLPPMKSFYFWEEQIQTDSEHLLLIKTLTEKYDELEQFIQANHSYDVPEIVTLAAERVSQSYLTWLENYLK